jgi:hypothetical protein
MHQKIIAPDFFRRDDYILMNGYIESMDACEQHGFLNEF